MRDQHIGVERRDARERFRAQPATRLHRRSIAIVGRCSGSTM
jgi:hypothetical protein